MKLHFEPDLGYQDTAIEAVCDLFRGQEICRTAFTEGHEVRRGHVAGQLLLVVADPSSRRPGRRPWMTFSWQRRGHA